MGCFFLSPYFKRSNGKYFNIIRTFINNLSDESVLHNKQVLKDIKLMIFLC